MWSCNVTKYWTETVSAEVSAFTPRSYHLKFLIPLHHATTFLLVLCSIYIWNHSKALIETNRLQSFASQNSKYSRSCERSKFPPWIHAPKSRANNTEISLFILLSIYSNISTKTMSFRLIQESISYNKTRSSQRITRNSQIPSSRKDIDESSQPSKKAKR